MHAGHTKSSTQDYKVSNWPQLSSEAYRTKCPIYSLLVCIAHFVTLPQSWQKLCHREFTFIHS